MVAIVVKHQVAFFYLFAYVVVVPCGLLMARFVVDGQPGPMAYVFSTLGAASPLLALTVLQRLTGGAVSLRVVFSKLRLRGADWRWLTAAALLYPILVVVARLVGFAAGTEPQLILVRPELAAALGVWLAPVMVLHFGTALFTSPLLEEPGWRGFALQPLQARFGRLVGSLVVALAWWGWHQPLNLALGVAPSVSGAVVMMLVSFLIDSLYNLSGRNLAAAMLAHQASGSANVFLRQVEGDVVFAGLLLLVVVTLRLLEQQAMRNRPPEEG